MGRQSGRGMIVLGILAFGLSGSGAAEPVVVRVGTGAEIKHPTQTLERLAELAKAQPSANVRVVLQGGVYRLDRPLVLERRHVPPRGSLTFAAADDQRVVLSGGKAITGWKVAADGTWSTTIPEVAERKWAFRELFVGGQRRPRARHPNVGFHRIVQAFEDKRTGFTFKAGDLPTNWTEGGELVFFHDWSTSRIPVKQVDHATQRLTVAYPIGNRADHYKIDHFEKHPRYYVENHRAFLDAPGEWFLDPQGELLYRPLPGENPENAEVIAPFSEALLLVRGDDREPIRHVHFQGLSFEHCAWQLPARGYAGSQATAHEQRDDNPSRGRNFVPAALWFERAEDCSVTRCRIAHLGTSGLQFGSHTVRCRLEDSIVEDISGNGVNLGEDTSRAVGGQPWWRAAPEQAASGHQVRYNRIQRCGQQFYGAVALWVGLARDCQISHNEIAHHPYTGISLGWIWNPTPSPAGGHLVRQNHIHHVMQVLSDGGGIYTLGRQPGTKLIGNVIHDVPVNLGSAESNGMFLDEGSDQIEIAGNTIYNLVRSPLRFHKAKKMTVRENTLVVSDETTPPLRYNNTNPKTIEQLDNRVIVQEKFVAKSVELPKTGPRPAKAQR